MGGRPEGLPPIRRLCDDDDVTNTHTHDDSCDDDCDGLYVCCLTGHGYHDDAHPCPGAAVSDLGMCDPGCHQGSHTSTCQGYEEFYQEGSAR